MKLILTDLRLTIWLILSSYQITFPNILLCDTLFSASSFDILSVQLIVNIFLEYPVSNISNVFAHLLIVLSVENIYRYISLLSEYHNRNVNICTSCRTTNTLLLSISSIINITRVMFSIIFETRKTNV